MIVLLCVVINIEVRDIFVDLTKLACFFYLSSKNPKITFTKRREVERQSHNVESHEVEWPQSLAGVERQSHLAGVKRQSHEV